jgi:hypothetical protein
VQEEKEEE